MNTPFEPRTFAAPYARDLVVSQSPDGRASIRVSIPGMIRTSAGPFSANTAREIAAAILEAAGVTDADAEDDDKVDEPIEAEIDEVVEVLGTLHVALYGALFACSCGYKPKDADDQIHSSKLVERHIAREALLAARAARRDEEQDR